LGRSQRDYVRKHFHHHGSRIAFQPTFLRHTNDVIMYEIILQASGASPQWWVTGWLLSIALLLVGLAIAAKYYDGTDDTPPDVDRSPEQGGAA
jgi:hypothetical protein